MINFERGKYYCYYWSDNPNLKTVYYYGDTMLYIGYLFGGKFTKLDTMSVKPDTMSIEPSRSCLGIWEEFTDEEKVGML